jgi:group I intron endonuclease
MAMSQGIYKITNLINDKTYIGQSVNIEKRWRGHISTSKNSKSKQSHYMLYKAFRKYGTQNFKFEILELVPNKKDLEFKELYYYKMYNPEYNMKIPQEQKTTTSIPVVQIDMKTFEKINEFESALEAQRKTGAKNIAFVCLRKTYSSGGYFWSYKHDYKKDWQPIENKQTKSIIQIDMKTLKPIQTFNSIAEAKKIYNTKASIESVCYGDNISAIGYYWCFENNYNENWKPKERNQKQIKKKVYQFDLHKNFIKEYGSILEASKKSGNNPSSIRKVCEGIYKQTKDSIWRYANEN